MAPRQVSDSGRTAPDSPRSSQSPPPSGVQGDLELELLGLANALYNLGTTVINDSTKERDKPGGGKQVGLRVNEVVHHLSTIDDMALDCRTLIPLQILTDIDNSRNPMQLTSERLERAATENQFMNGKIAALDSYRQHLDQALALSFPELGPYLHSSSTPHATHVVALHANSEDLSSKHPDHDQFSTSATLNATS